MGWYDLFSRFYDSSLEPLYAEQRVAGAEALRLEPGQVVLDLPAGTGQSFPALMEGVGPEGRLLGVDLSTGMLARAQARIDKQGWGGARLLHSDVHELDSARLQSELGRPDVDRLHIFLGMTAFPRHEEAFERLWGLLRPGGRCVIVDVHTEKLGFQGWMVNLVARAEIRRRFWEPLEAVAEGFERKALPSLPDHGGTIYVATGDKPVG